MQSRRARKFHVTMTQAAVGRIVVLQNGGPSSAQPICRLDGCNRSRWQLTPRVQHRLLDALCLRHHLLLPVSPFLVQSLENGREARPARLRIGGGGGTEGKKRKKSRREKK